MKKVLKSILIIVIILSITQTYCFAISPSVFRDNGSTVIAGGDKMLDLGRNIFTVITTIGIVISVALLIIIGIKYMIGSIEEKAQYKKTMMPYLVGATILFAASTFAQIIYTVAQKL